MGKLTQCCSDFVFSLCHFLFRMLMLPPPQAFLIFFSLAQRAFGRLGVNKKAREGAGSE